MKWCTDSLVRRTLVLGVWSVGAMILFLEVALLGTWLCHLHAPSVMMHKVTCSIVSRSVPPSQISVNSGVVDVPYIRIPSDSGCGTPWLFNPTSSFNTFRTVLADVSFTGQACERFISL